MSLSISFFQQNVVKMKKMFNEMFNRMCKIKENEMSLITQRNKRLQIIHDDINLLEELNGKQRTDFECVPIFEYSDDEKLWSTFEVEKLTIDQSPHEQKHSESHILDEQMNSFYSRALDEIMNGVIEVHWEDEMKRDLPKPDCLLKEFPSELEKEQIDKYQQKLQKIRIERNEMIEKMRNEKSDLENLRAIQVHKLNKCIENLMKSKISAQFAVCSEELEIMLCLADRKKYVSMCEMEQRIT